MRSSNELGSDGLYNFESAIRVASCEEALDKGVLVVMNDEIHSARYVTKTHTTNVATFRTPTLGPIGLVTKNRILFLQELLETKRLDISAVDGTIPIVKSICWDARGLIGSHRPYESRRFGNRSFRCGESPSTSLSCFGKASCPKIPVVLVSRCFNGIAEPVYDYEGGEKN